MSLKLYQINTTLNHPDCMAGLKKMMDDEIFSFFRLDIGNEEKIKRRRLEFVAGTGYTLENIEKTDYIFCPSALLFSKRFVEKIGNLLREEMKFFSCRLVCQDVSLEWYAAKIILSIPIIDKEASTYRTLTTTDPKVIEKWNEPGQRIVMFDTDDVIPDVLGNKNIIDISTPEKARAAGLKRGRPYSNAVSSKEVLAEGRVPANKLTITCPG